MLRFQRYASCCLLFLHLLSQQALALEQLGSIRQRTRVSRGEALNLGPL